MHALKKTPGFPQFREKQFRRINICLHILGYKRAYTHKETKTGTGRKTTAFKRRTIYDELREMPHIIDVLYTKKIRELLKNGVPSNDEIKILNIAKMRAKHLMKWQGIEQS